MKKNRKMIWNYKRVYYVCVTKLLPNETNFPRSFDELEVACIRPGWLGARNFFVWGGRETIIVFLASKANYGGLREFIVK